MANHVAGNDKVKPRYMWPVMWLILLGVLEFQIKARGQDCVSRVVLFRACYYSSRVIHFVIVSPRIKKIVIFLMLKYNATSSNQIDRLIDRLILFFYRR